MSSAYEKVFRLDVTVDYALAVAELDRFAELVYVLLDVLGLILDYVDAVRTLFKDLEQVALHVLEDQVELALAAKSLFELDYIIMLQHAQDFYLPYRGFADSFVFL